MKHLLRNRLLHSPRRNPSVLFSSNQGLYQLRQKSGSSKSGKHSPSKPTAPPAPDPRSSKTTTSKSQLGERRRPPLLPPKLQKEFEESVRKAQGPSHSFTSTLMATTTGEAKEEVALELHPDAPKQLPPEFVGDVNPATGEIGGPKREPLKFGDWSYGGKVTDF